MAAAAEVLEAASRAGDTWNTPRTPGGWSPAQVVEHVSLTLEQGAAVVSGRQSKFPNFPAILRPLARGLYYNRVLKEGRFPRSRTTAALEPSQDGATLAEADARLQAAVRNFNQACRDRLANGRPLSIRCSAPCRWRATPSSRCCTSAITGPSFPMISRIPSGSLP